MPANNESLAKIDAKADAISREELIWTAAEINGAIRAVNQLQEDLASQVIRGLQRFRDEKLHEAFGFTSFEKYLDQSPKSPMSYDKFNRREKLLLSEGDEAYNLLEAVRVPLSARKALPPDSFEVRDDQLIVKDESGEEYEIPLAETRRIKSVISNIAREFDKKKRELQQTIKTADALIKRNKELADAKPKPNAELTTPHGEALLFAIAALNNLAEKADELTDAEAIEQRKNAMDLIGQQMTKLHTAYRFSLEKPDTAAPRKSRKPTDAEIQEALGN